MGLGAAGPPPQAAALPRHRLGGDSSRGPQGRAADAGRQGTGRGDAAGSRSPHTRHGACCGDRDPRPLSMRDVGCSPACPSGYSPWQGALACSAGVQPMSPASVCLSVCLPPLCYGLPVPFEPTPALPAAPPALRPPASWGGWGASGARARWDTGGACPAQSLPEPARGPGTGTAALAAPSPPPAGDFALRHPSRQRCQLPLLLQSYIQAHRGVPAACPTTTVGVQASRGCGVHRPGTPRFVLQPPSPRARPRLRPGAPARWPGTTLPPSRWQRCLLG